MPSRLSITTIMTTAAIGIAIALLFVNLRPATTVPPSSAIAPVRSVVAHAEQSHITLVIPRLHIQVPVYERGVDARGNLPIAPGRSVTHWSGSAPLGGLGNYVIYGHDDIEGEVFAYLPSLQPGDHLYLHEGIWVYDYRVTGSRIVAPSAIGVLAPTAAATLTAISCTPYNVDSERIVVTAALARVQG